MRGDRVRSECWVHSNFDGSYGKAISQLVARLLRSRHFQSCRSPHCLPVFNRNVSFLSFLAGDRGMARLQILHLTTNSTNGKISVSAIIRRHLWRFLVCCDDLRHPRSWISLTASQPAFWHHFSSSESYPTWTWSSTTFDWVYLSTIFRYTFAPLSCCCSLPYFLHIASLHTRIIARG